MGDLREWAEVYLDELSIALLEDPALYVRYGGEAAQTVTQLVESLRMRVQHSNRAPNPAYDRQGDVAASLLILAMGYPEHYSSLMQHVVGGGSVRTIDGALRLSSVLSALSDDHDYVLLKENAGARLYHETQQPAHSLTCSQDLAAVTCQLLQAAGFEAFDSSRSSFDRTP